MNIVRNLIEDSGIRTRSLNKIEEFAICCPDCGDTEFRCYVNPYKVKYGVTGWSYCHRRGCTNTLNKLLKKFGITGYKSNEVVYIPTSFDLVKNRLLELGNISFEEEQVMETKLLDFDFEQFKLPLKNNSNMAKRALQYLIIKREFTDEQIDKYQLRYCDDGEYVGRIIIPFFEYEKLVYFQARSFPYDAEVKVLNPPLGVFVNGKSDCLFNFDQARLYRTVTICEGWASAITAGWSAVAINGNKASETQLNKLVDNWSNFIVMLDKGVEDCSFRLAKEILYKKPTASVKIVLLPYGDPNNFKQKHLNYLIEQARVYKNKAEIEMAELRFLTSKVQVLK